MNCNTSEFQPRPRLGGLIFKGSTMFGLGVLICLALSLPGTALGGEPGGEKRLPESAWTGFSASDATCRAASKS